MLSLWLMAIWITASPLSAQDVCILRWAGQQSVSSSVLARLSPDQQEAFWRELTHTLAPNLKGHRQRYAVSLRRGDIPVCGTLE